MLIWMRQSFLGGILKKLAIFICVLLLCSFPIMAEESLPVPISIHIETQLGANLVPDITELNFVNLNVPFVDDWADADNIITWELSWRGGQGSQQKLICELTQPLTGETTAVPPVPVELDPAVCIQQVWTGLITATLPGPPADGSPQIVFAIGSSTGSGTAQLQMQFFNEIGLPGMIVDGVFTYTILTGV